MNGSGVGRKAQGQDIKLGGMSKKYGWANEVAKAAGRNRVCRALERKVRQAGRKACREVQE